MYETSSLTTTTASTAKSNECLGTIISFISSKTFKRSVKGSLKTSKSVNCVFWGIIIINPCLTYRPFICTFGSLPYWCHSGAGRGIQLARCHWYERPYKISAKVWGRSARNEKGLKTADGVLPVHCFQQRPAFY